jgi:hypothetical protein
MSKHTLTLHDPITNADQPVQIAIDRQGDQWHYVASFGHVVLAHGDDLWFEREEDVLALAQERSREAMRARDPRAYPKV